jgi:hypothetical protein
MFFEGGWDDRVLHEGGWDDRVLHEGGWDQPAGPGAK